MTVKPPGGSGAGYVSPGPSGTLDERLSDYVLGLLLAAGIAPDDIEDFEWEERPDDLPLLKVVLRSRPQLVRVSLCLEQEPE